MRNMNEGRFIYVFDTVSRDKLLKAGFVLLASDEKNAVYVFSRENRSATFTFDGIEHILSNTLSF